MSTIRFAAEALRTARERAADELARIDAALAALDVEHTEVADPAPMARGGLVKTSGVILVNEFGVQRLNEEADGTSTRRKASTGKTYPCAHPGCEFVAKSPGGLGGHMNRHRPRMNPPAPVMSEARPMDTEDDEANAANAPHVCDECGETFTWLTELSRHRRTLGHYQEDKA